MGFGTLGLLDGDDTLLIDLAHRLGDRTPMVPSLLAEIVATCSIFAKSVPTVWLCFLSESTTTPTALSIPRLRSIGLAPAVTFFSPTPIIACASTVAVVVPSPASSLVFEATSLTIWAPMLGIASSRLHLLGDGHTVLGHLGSTELLVDDYVASFGTERYLHSVRQSVHALLEKAHGLPRCILSLLP